MRIMDGWQAKGEERKRDKEQALGAGLSSIVRHTKNATEGDDSSRTKRPGLTTKASPLLLSYTHRPKYRSKH